MEKENRSTCERISRELDNIARGNVYACPHCGEWISDGDGATYDEIHDVITCPHCNTDFNSDDAEPVSMWDYFETTYNVEYRIDGNKEYKSIALMIACGGPNIYVDTGSGRVELYWWGSNAHYPLSDDARAEIDEFGEMLYGC